MGNVEEEADESGYWMELLLDAGIGKRNPLEALLKEADELVAMTVASIRTARHGRIPSQPKPRSST
jgi:four helix bundle protein